MPTLTAKQLAQVAITASLVTIYTVPASTTAVIQSIDIVNTSGGVRTVRVHIVPSGGSAGTANALLYDITIADTGTINYGGPLTIETGGFISVLADSTGMTITVSGLEIT